MTLVTLTRREYQILVALSYGDTRETIAKALNLSVSTVKTHKGTLFNKFGASSLGEAIRVGFEQGFLTTGRPHSVGWVPMYEAHTARCFQAGQCWCPAGSRPE